MSDAGKYSFQIIHQVLLNSVNLNVDVSTLIVLAVTTILSFVASAVLFWFARNRTKHNLWPQRIFFAQDRLR